MFKWLSDMFGAGTDMSKPAVNVDGTPMVGDVDTNGNVFGVTDDSFSNSGFDTGGFDSGGGFDNDF